MYSLIIVLSDQHLISPYNITTFVKWTSDENIVRQYCYYIW